METMSEKMAKIRQAEEYVKSQPGFKKPQIGIILGSGLGKLGEEIKASLIIPYKDIPNFVKSTAVGHKGNLIIGELAGKTVVAMQGRFHFYEGYSMEQVTLPVRMMKVLGVETVFVSNASGGLNPTFKTGDLMIIKDHINMIPNPLIGPNYDEFGVRFPDMTCVYDQDIIRLAEQVAEETGIKVQKGIYLGNTGPTYETPAEVRYYRLIGGDVTGMSTIPEVIVARQCGMKVFGMSIVTNMSNDTYTLDNLNDGDDVVREANIAADKMCTIFKGLLARI